MEIAAPIVQVALCDSFGVATSYDFVLKPIQLNDDGDDGDDDYSYHGPVNRLEPSHPYPNVIFESTHQRQLNLDVCDLNVQAHIRDDRRGHWLRD